MVLSDTLSGKELWAREEKYADVRFSKDSQTLAIYLANFFDKPEVTFRSAKTGEVVRTFYPLVADPKKDKKVPQDGRSQSRGI